MRAGIGKEGLKNRELTLWYLCVYGSLVEKKKKFNPTQSRKANSEKDGLLYTGNPSCGSTGGNISRLRRAGFVLITVLSLGMTSKAKSAAWAAGWWWGGGLRRAEAPKAGEHY